MFSEEILAKLNETKLPTTTAQERFHARIALFRKEKKPVLAHHAWWFLHNVVAHPLIGVFPTKVTFLFHDYTSDKINGK